MKRLQLIFAAWVLLFYSVASYAAYDTLGATVLYANGTSQDATGTRFSIWNPDNIAPASVWVQYPGQESFTECPLSPLSTFSDNSINPYTNVYSTTISQNLDGCQYYFTFNGTVVRDPYAKMTTGMTTDTPSVLESQYATPATAPNPTPACTGPATNVVIDFNNPKYKFETLAEFNNKRPALAQLTDAIVYELNVVDYTSNNTSTDNPGVGVTNPGTFAGLVQSGTNNGQTTGLQNLVDLGITHVQIMPMYTYDFSGYSYNWGYNPLDYNVPQAQFSMYPLDQYTNRISEVQNMINAFHKNGLRVVMDVVFNHTYSSSVFTPNSPVSNAYYVMSNGCQTDYSGCGNTVDVKNPMVSNMVADSLAYWMTVYGIDGYRFDEMYIFPDTVVSQWVQYLNGLNPNQNYIYYGEPWWSPGGEPYDDGCSEANISCTEYMNGTTLTPGAGCFNGPYRCALIGQSQKGPSSDNNTFGGYIFNEVSNSNEWAAVMGNVEAGFNGSIRTASTATTNSVPLAVPNNSGNSVTSYANMPFEAINYVSCHDGLCLWDKISAQEAYYNGQSESWSNQYLQQIDMFSLGILMTSQGVPFIYEGDEFLRSKNGNPNSYNGPLSDNWISWSNKNTNLNAFNYYKKLIALRKNNPAFSQGSWTDISNNSKVYDASNSDTQDGVLVGILNDNSGNQFTVIYNCNTDYSYKIPSGSWMLLTNINDTGIALQAGQYPAVGTVFNQEGNVLCCGTSVTVLANMANPTKPVANPL